jgi:hypothetical protein
MNIWIDNVRENIGEINFIFGIFLERLKGKKMLIINNLMDKTGE